MAQPLNARANTRLHFISSYRGCADYRVQGGPMDGKRVKVTSSDVAFLVKDWNDGKGWNISRHDYERDVIGGAGMITDGLHGPVTDDVIDAYRRLVNDGLDRAEKYALHHSIDGMDAAYFAERRQELAEVCTGKWEMGWIRYPIHSQDHRVLQLAA